ncbi:MAG: patatin-like phospholipase family protein [Caulobacteraceae bacterium]
MTAPDRLGAAAGLIASAEAKGIHSGQNRRTAMVYRVLSLDGGGVWAVIQVKALIALYGEAATGRAVLQDFDLVAGTSGGSIVLGGLVENVALGQLLEFFADAQNRRAIFSPTQMLLDRVLSDAIQMGPKYSAEAKLPALEKLMPTSGNVALSSVVTGVRRQAANTDVHLLITAFDYDRSSARFFRSAAATGPDWGSGAPSDATLAEAIHASTNAPVVFFDEPAAFGGGRYWDGAITGCNNPVLAAVAEAIVLGNPPDTIAALSIGTSTPALVGPPEDNPSSPFFQARPKQNLLTDLRMLASSVTDEPPDIATFLAHVMTGGKSGVSAPAVSRIVRMNPLRSPVSDGAGGWKAPGAMTPAQFKYFCNVAMDALDPNQFSYITTYADDWLDGLAPNQPIRMNSDTLEAELGYGLFAEAKAAWEAIR